MNQLFFGIAGLGTQELIIILLIVFVLFGASRLPQLAKALGQSKRAFRQGLDEAEEEAQLEETRRRERLRAAEANVREEEIASDKFTVNKPR
ncbi:MAG: twin-arginine translocase TatA/TatE family subunit [Pyrinomonadaceae bacterium]|nr:twin-arginine translocase TatA/TatE family subunit [Pyrinomonadaceae bacterium]MDQ3584141.1 twin-arginine translocase TatA/TatE family subunit [Acidobacteriota bacterium]